LNRSDLGLAQAVSKEVDGIGATTKKYSYDVFGNRATITESANRYSYLYDPHRSVNFQCAQRRRVVSKSWQPLGVAGAAGDVVEAVRDYVRLARV